jgi:hypothetical protein
MSRREFNVREFVQSRPTGITILGGLSVVLGLFALCSGVVGVAGATLQALTCTGLDFVTPLKALATGVLRLAVGGALLNGAGWARTATIVISVINLLILIPGGFAGGEFWNAILSVAMIIYMMTPGVTRYFSQR